MGCRRMLGVEDRAAIMAGVNVGLSKTRIAHLIGRSPSVVCREIARHTGPDGQYRAEEADKAARAARRRSKKRLLDCDEVLRRRVIADLSRTLPARSAHRLRMEACGTLPSMDTSPDAHSAISHEAIDTWIDAPQEDAHRARHLLALAPVDAQETPGERAQTPHRWDAAD